MFHCSHQFLEEGDQVQPGNWGRVLLGYGPAHNRFYPEYIFERVRKAEFPGKPSRLACCFACETLDAAQAFAALTTPPQIVYAVEQTSHQHRGDWSWIDQETMKQFHTFDGVESCAREYWNGTVHDPRRIELLIAEPLTVTERLTQFRDNGTAGN